MLKLKIKDPERQLFGLIEKATEEVNEFGRKVAELILPNGKVFELTRIEERKRPRKDWQKRWQSAGEAVKWAGVLWPKEKEDEKERKPKRMIAYENSPIWRALARGEGGFRDVIGEGKPPFAYGSGMGWKILPSIHNL